MVKDTAVFERVSTHSRLKAAGCRKSSRDLLHSMVSTHSRLKAAGDSAARVGVIAAVFQHTAA